MNIFENLLPRDLYHSYIITSDDREGAARDLLLYLENKKYITAHSPDVIVENYDSFTILDSKFIKDWASNKKVSDGLKVCIIATKFINREAEQTLLKILEEPGENTHFFIIIPSSVVLLDTIVSRCHILHIDSGNQEEKKVAEFIKLSPKDRIDFIATLIKEHENDESSGGLRHDAITIINSVEASLHEKLKASGNSELEFAFGELRNAREYLGAPGASVKMILEHVAMVI